MKDEDIDLSDLSEIPPEKFAQAVVRKGLQPVKLPAARSPRLPRPRIGAGLAGGELRLAGEVREEPAGGGVEGGREDRNGGEAVEEAVKKKPGLPAGPLTPQPSLPPHSPQPGPSPGERELKPRPSSS
jgi:hypothetical protein